MTTHSETRHLPFTPRQMYDLVADVARYPEFLPWCAAARIRSREALPEGGDGAEVMEADLVISFKLFRERFGSRVELHPQDMRIETQYIDGPFRYMHSTWRFDEAASGQGTDVHFHTDFEFRNAVLRGVIGMVFNEAMQRIVGAFERRAHELYGDSSKAGGKAGGGSA